MRRARPIFISALALTGVNLLLRLLGTGFQVSLSGQIGAVGIGLLQLVLSAGALAMTAGIAGVRTAAMSLTAEEIGKKNEGTLPGVLRACTGYSLVCSSTVGAILYALAPTLARVWIGTAEVTGAIRLIAVFLPVTCLCGVLSGYFTAANRILTLAAVEVAEQLCAMAVSVGLLHSWAGENAARACFSVAAGSCGGAVLTLTLLLMLLRLPAKRAKISVTRRLLNTAVPLAIADDCKAGISAGENFMVPQRLALFGGCLDPLALFGMIVGMIFPIIMFPAAILYALAELLIPEVARSHAALCKRRIPYLIRRSLRTALLYGLTCGGLLFLEAEHLCRLLYDAPEAAHYLRLFAPLIPMLYCDIITDAVIKGLGQQKTCVRYNILTSALDVALLFFLLPEYGARGYFLSFLVTHLLNFILSLRKLLQLTRLSFRPAMPMLSLAACLSGVYSASLLPGPGLRTAAFLCMFFPLLILFGVLTREDWRWAEKLLSTH